MVDFLIVGAGLYGATCANLLHNYGFTCLVIDKRSHIAGNIYSEKNNGIDVHKYGPHIFHTDSEQVWNFVNKFTNMIPFQLNTIANYNEKLYHLPFNLTTMYELFGTRNIVDIKNKIKDEAEEWWKDYSVKHPNSDINDNLETFAISQVGTTIYETLIKGYTEKQWGKPCYKLSADIIKRLPIRYLFNNNYFNDKYQGIPENGYTIMVRNMLNGIPVLLNQDYIVNIDYWNSQAKWVIYCGAVDELCDYELGELEWRSLNFDEKVIDTTNFQGIPIMNFTSADVAYTRVIEHKWFTPYKYNEIAAGKSIDGNTVITFEYPKKWERGMDMYYSVNNDKTNILYHNYCELLKMKYPNLYLGGRLGLYKYMDMDDTILAAMEFVEYIKNNIDNVCEK